MSPVVESPNGTATPHAPTVPANGAAAHAAPSRHAFTLGEVAKGKATQTRSYAEKVALLTEMFNRTPDIHARAAAEAVKAKFGRGIDTASLYEIRRAVRGGLGLEPSARSPQVPSAHGPRRRHGAAEGGGRRGNRARPRSPELPAGMEAAAELLAEQARDAAWFGTITIERRRGAAPVITWEREVAAIASGRRSLAIDGEARRRVR